MRERPIALSALAGALLLAVLLLAVTAAAAGSDSTIQFVGMDADPSGNTATALGHLDPCIRAEPGAEVTVDLVVDAVPDDRPFIGYQIEVNYDPTVSK
jgi:hypothetical protein